jgi:predicted nuclease of predicted toxin-antitoxin system
LTVRFVADENFNRRIVAGLHRRSTSVDIVRVQDVGLRSADDPTVLEWAGAASRILLTHDIVTMPEFARNPLAAARPARRH